MKTLDTVKKALQARKDSASGDFFPYIPALSFALSDDAIFDPIMTIPIVGLVAAVPSSLITIYLFIFLFGRGTWKVKAIVFVLQVLDWFPVLNLLPMSTVSVLYVYSQAKKKADQAKKALGSLDAQTNRERMQEYQMARARMAAEEVKRLEQYQAQEVANDAQYNKDKERKVA